MQIEGVTPEEETVIKSIIEPYSDKYDFFCYGSRVKGNFRFLSDLDLMIKGEKAADSDIINDLKTKFDERNLSYVVNISDYYQMDESFYKLIKQDLVKIN